MNLTLTILRYVIII